MYVGFILLISINMQQSSLTPFRIEDAQLAAHPAREAGVLNEKRCKNDDLIYLPVSLGEAIDKLTILDIKLQKINDNRCFDVQKEYDLLYIKLDHFVAKYSDLYQTMKKVNILIWDMMDLLRDGSLSENEYLRVCRECIEFNDIRFRVKNKINYASNSELREQKGYRINRIVIDIADDIVEIDEFIRPIRYLSFIYDEIVIVSCNHQLITEFQYDPTIKFENEFKIFENEHIFMLSKKEYNKTELYSIFRLDENMVNSILGY